MKTGYTQDLAKAALDNNNFRRVLYTGEHLQLVVMTLKPGEEIGEEVHEDRDQFFHFEQGGGEVVIDGKKHKIAETSGVIVPAGARHNVINTGNEPLKMVTLYGPPEHKDGTVHKTRDQAEKDEENDHFDGKTTE